MIDAHILVVDDDRRLRDLLCQYLTSEGFRVSVAPDALTARAMFKENVYDLLVIDVMMRGESGLELTRFLKKSSSVPILMLTAMSEVEDRISGLESGADDYLTKPFEPRELYLRIENLLKRTRTNIIKFGDYSLNINNGELRKNGDFVDLTSTELSLLTILGKSLNTPVSREKLSKQLNGISERSIDVQMTRLRKKIETDIKSPRYLLTEWGEGYVLKDRD